MLGVAGARPRPLSDELASSSSVGLIVALGLFASGFVVSQNIVADTATRDTGEDVHLDSQAKTALDLLIREDGWSTSGAAWPEDADNIVRFGLAKPGQPNFLAYESVRALRNGTYNATLNGAPDYPDVVTALGLVDLDFHLRSYPALPNLDDPRWTKEPHGRVAYLAHTTGAVVPAAVWTSSVNDASGLAVDVNVRNDGAEAAIYTVTISLGDRSAESTFITHEVHTPLIAPGQVETFTVTFPPLAAYDSAIDAVFVQVVDPYSNIAEDLSGDEVGAIWVPTGAPPSSGSTKALRLVNADTVYEEAGDDLTFIFDHADGTGAHTAPATTGRYVLIGPDGNEWVNESVTLPTKKNKVLTKTCTNCTTTGAYEVRFLDDSGGLAAFDNAYVAASEMFTASTSLAGVALNEITILGGLVGGFEAATFDATTAPGGDIFADDSNGPHDIVDVLSRYTTLVVGSQVTQTALNAASTKYAIADWVQAGGTLVVLGTVDVQSRWLEPVYHAAQTNANGGISAPDPSHPVLTTPNRLSHQSYLDNARAWSIKDGTPFTHVLSRGISGNSRLDTLAVGEPGAFGNGTVVLTSYLPGALADPQDDAEAKRLLHNLMSQSFNMLFIDYGPELREGVPIGTAERLVAVEHPNVPGAIVEVKLVLYVFG